MKPWAHLLFSSILAVILYPIFNLKVLFILVGGVLIDVDHYLWYILKYKRFNIFKCYRYFAYETRKNNYKEVIGSLIIFHTIEFMFSMILLSFYNELILIFTIGLLSHYFLDLIFLYFVPKRFIANHSLLWWIIKNNIQKA